LAAVPGERLFRLHAAEPEGYEWVPATSWVHAVTLIRTRPIEMAVVDPMLGGEPRSMEIAHLRRHFPSLPLVVYTTLAPETAGVLLDLGRAGIRRVLFHRFDDAPSALRRALHAELEESASQRLMQQLTGALPDLPEPLREALEVTLHAPGDGPTVSALAERAQLKRRTCERWFARLGLPSPKMVMLLARVLYAHRLLLDPGYTVEDVALKLGYARAKTLQMHFREVFGLTAGEVRLSLSPDEAMRLIADRYLHQPSQAAS
jgi:AraC-like DNA-binding protein